MSARKEFEPEASSVRAVRLFVGEALPPWARREDVVLVASELATNVVRHARTDFRVDLAVEQRRMRLEVSDGSSIVPAVEDLADNQHGLRMIEALSDRWGIESTPTGKTVWVEFDELSVPNG